MQGNKLAIQKEGCRTLHIKDMNIISPANSDCKGVLFQHEGSRPPRILEVENGKEHPDLGKHGISKKTLRSPQGSYFGIIFQFVLIVEVMLSIFSFIFFFLTKYHRSFDNYGL